jgi:hypothetical protein
LILSNLPNNDPQLPLAFCQATQSEKLAWLHHWGLERYGQLLGQLRPTAGNLACLERCFARPDRLKFPPLQGTDLAGLDLGSCNLIRANFSQANLQGCSLVGADSMFANFTQADLRGADLRGATLQETLWHQAIVAGCNLQGAQGLGLEQQRWLAAQGAML